MEVSSPSFPVAHVLPMKKMKTDGPKNKVFKPHRCGRYLTRICMIMILIFFFFFIFSLKKYFNMTQNLEVFKNKKKIKKKIIFNPYVFI
jgi:magnesium-transporting ATPase (P-type)